MSGDDDIEEIRKKKLKKLKKDLEKNKMTETKSEPKKVDESNFEAFKEKHNKAVIDAWAEWCGPCKKLEPVIKDLAKEYEDVAFGKLNVDENQGIAARYGIRAIPTLFFFKNGELVDQLTGAVPEQSLKQKIEETLL